MLPPRSTPAPSWTRPRQAYGVAACGWSRRRSVWGSQGGRSARWPRRLQPTLSCYSPVGAPTLVLALTQSAIPHASYSTTSAVPCCWCAGPHKLAISPSEFTAAAVFGGVAGCRQHARPELAKAWERLKHSRTRCTTSFRPRVSSRARFTLNFSAKDDAVDAVAETLFSTRTYFRSRASAWLPGSATASKQSRTFPTYRQST